MANVRLLWLVGAAVALVLGLWGGLARLGWGIPALLPHHATAHGPLMIGGFLGALIGLERAVALGRGWGYLVPALAVASTLWTALSSDWRPAALLLTAASVAAVAVFAQLLRRRLDLAASVMGLGTLCWLIGNAGWAASGFVILAIPWWAAFLVLTILGERLELARVLAPSRGAIAVFLAGLGILVGGLLLAYLHHDLGQRAFGFGCVVLAIWGLDQDLARRTLRFGGQHRFTAVCLLGGYLWLAVAGTMMLLWGDRLGGLEWDAALHALFLGFVFSMIFGHAPLVARLVLGVELAFSTVFYGHLALLHLSLLIRVTGDLLDSPAGRAVGALLNLAAIAAFLLATLRAAVQGALARRSRSR